MNRSKLWIGEKVRLRAVVPEDWQIFQAWDEDTEVARLCYEIPFPRSPENTRRFAEVQASAEPRDDAFRWIIENRTGTPVGNLNSHSCSRRHGTFSYGLAIMREHWRQGYATEAIQIVLEFFFNQLGYQKATVNIYGFNTASIRLHERLGFQHEGCLRRMIFSNGAYHDEIILGLTAEEFRSMDPGNEIGVENLV